MGFIKWLYLQYKQYKLEKLFPGNTQEEKERLFMSNYARCLEVGFTDSQISAILNLVWSGDNCKKGEKNGK